MIKPLTEIFLRDLDRVAAELKQFENQGDMWAKPEGISNSAGTLSLHLLGNLNHFIGAQLGNSGYVRQRDKEFSDHGIGLSVLLIQLEDVKKTIEDTLVKWEGKDLSQKYPIKVFADKREVTIEFMLIHLATHLNYHLGQINYFRRLLNN